MLTEGSGALVTPTPALAARFTRQLNLTTDATTFGFLDDPLPTSAVANVKQPFRPGAAADLGKSALGSANRDVRTDAQTPTPAKAPTFPLASGNFLQTANVTRTMNTPAPTSTTDIITIVGAACGAAGLLLGIIITAGVCMCVQKRRARRSYGRRNTSVAQKHPKEETFEPLDLTLTLPSYGHVSVATEQRSSRENLPATQQSTPRQPAASECQPNSSYQGFSPPTPPQPSHNGSYDLSDAFRRSKDIRELGETFGYVNDRFSAHEDLESIGDACASHLSGSHAEPNGSANRKPHEESPGTRLASVTTRGSFSSGLGTGTESDTLPHDWCPPGRDRPWTHQKRDAQSPRANGSESKSSKRQQRVDVHWNEGGRGNCSKLGSPRRKDDSAKRSLNSTGKYRSTGLSDASSSYPSSGSSSVHDWSTDTSCSPASTLPSHHDAPVPCFAAASAILEADDDASLRLESDDVRDDASEGTAASDDDVVSTYFDMHFPPTPLRSQSLPGVKKTLTVQKRAGRTASASAEPKERRSEKMALTHRPSDLAIDL